jgi:hypothetical protein
MRPALKLLDGATAVNGVPSNTAATGSITAAAGNTIVNGSSFVLHDGINAPVQFVFDSTAAVVVSATKKAIAYTTGDNAATIKAAIRAAIDAVTTALRITTSDPGGVGITLTNDFGGVHGNVPLANTTTLAMSGMSGGITVGFPLNGAVPGGLYHWVLQDMGLLILHSTAGSGAMSISVRIWIYSETTHAWQPLGISATIVSRGLLNDGVLITADPANTLAHAEIVQGLSGGDYIYAEVTAAPGGVGTAVDLFLVSCARQVAA